MFLCNQNCITGIVISKSHNKIYTILPDILVNIEEAIYAVHVYDSVSFFTNQ